MVLYPKINQKLRNKLHGQMHYTIDVIYMYSKTRDRYSCVTTLHSNPPISKCNRRCNEFTSVWSMFPCNTLEL